MPTLPLTLAVITHNEAESIARCLDSVPFAAEKLVVDSGSDDDTVAIAQAHGARVVYQDWLGFGAQRNFASSQCRPMICTPAASASLARSPWAITSTRTDLPVPWGSTTVPRTTWSA